MEEGGGGECSGEMKEGRVEREERRDEGFAEEGGGGEGGMGGVEGGRREGEERGR